jgi:5-formyltetrahydrofolate cyclo-ligase
MNDKPQLRKDAQTRRVALAATLPDFAARIAAFADELRLPKGVIVSGYWAYRDEADPGVLMKALGAKGHPLALPRIDQRAAPLQFRRWNAGDEVRTSAFGVIEPTTGAEIVKPSVLLVPLLAFDEAGHRLGYGGGYYDRTLAQLRAHGTILAIGIAYAGQEVRALPHDRHDQRLDAVLTEKGLRRFPPDRA